MNARRIVVLLVVLLASAPSIQQAPTSPEAGSPGLGSKQLGPRLLQQAGPRPLPSSCPGLVGGACKLPCQRVTCEALGTFFRLTFNKSLPWEQPQTWNITLVQPCEKIIPARVPGQQPPRRPAYCSWYGISCCSPAEKAAGSCPIVDGVANISLASDSVNGSLSDGAFMDALEQLHACGLVGLDLEANDMSGEIDGERWAKLTNLKVLNLANNWLSGTIPPELGRLKRLQRLELGTNFFQGTIGPWLGDLTELTVLGLGANGGINEAAEGEEELAGIIGPIPQSLGNLTHLVELDLQTNSLTGSIPEALCSNNPMLNVLNLRSNRLTGQAAHLERCRELVSLDLAVNALTGRLPATPDWSKMVALKLGDNQFSGQLPLDVFDIPMLSYLDISGNKLTGTPSFRINLLTYMTELDASSNNLSGPIKEDFFFLPQLALLNLADNHLTGTLPASIGLAFGLEELNVANNTAIIGRLPNEAGGLGHLRRVQLQGTGMSCIPEEIAHAQAVSKEAAVQGNAPSQVDSYIYRCPEDELLPCFLQFEAYDVPRSDESHMRCRPIKRKASDQIAEDCPAATLGEDSEAADIARNPDHDGQRWELSPSYFQYHGCNCLGGFLSVRTLNETHLECVPERKTGLPPWAWVLIAVGSVAALMLAALALLGSRWKLLRSKWLREVDLVRKRASGLPEEGSPVTVVVTDIEGYSDLMKASPGITVKVLNMHNAIMRKAAHTHAGHAFEMEGDSWAVAFHDAFDAVAFCLQVQQALHKVNWPHRLSTKKDALDHGMSFDFFGSLSSTPEFGYGGSVIADHIVDNGAAAASATAAASPGASFGNSPEPTQHSFSSVLQMRQISCDRLSLARSDASEREGWHAHGGGGAPGPQPSSALPRQRSGGSSVLLSLLTKHGSAPSVQRLFCGLRVRMGVATGVVEKGAEVANCGVHALAKVVCDMGHGGQVLIESATFDQVKHRNAELGAIDHHGYDDRLLVSYQDLRSRLGHCCSFYEDAVPYAESSNATIFDMGEYTMAEAAAPPAAAAAQPAPPPPTPDVGGGEGGSAAAAAPGAVAAPRAAKPPSRLPSFEQMRLRVYSVLAPALADRARVWGAELFLRDGCYQTEKGFFDAPSAPLLAPTDSVAAAMSGNLPPVTLVFAAVDGARSAVRALPAAYLRAALRLLRATLLAAVDQTPGAYLCREQEGAMCYMVAFPTASGALRWCLAVQDALLLAPWPAALLSLPGMGEEREASTGALLFRGPRLKMGLSEGPPRSILPDNNGRADFYGESVNQAARFMNAAAHGGQVVCEARLAEAVFREWAVRARTGTFSGAGRQSDQGMAVESAHPDHPGGGGGNSQVGGAFPPQAPGSPVMSTCHAARSAPLRSHMSDDWSAWAASVSTGAGAHTGNAGGSISRAASATAEGRGVWRSPSSFGKRSSAGARQVPAGPLVEAPVHALHLGTFVFKGTSQADMVSVTTAALTGRHALLPDEPPKGKGKRIAHRTGPAGTAVALLPDLLAGSLRDRFVATANAQRLAAGDAASAGYDGDGVGEASAYAAWLCKELSQRKAQCLPEDSQ